MTLAVAVIMAEQLHRQLPQELITEILEAFSRHEISEAQACELLGMKRSRLYELERRYLQNYLKGGRGGCQPAHIQPGTSFRWKCNNFCTHSYGIFEMRRSSTVARSTSPC